MDTQANAAILQYLQRRGLSDSVIRRFGIGASPAQSFLEKQLTTQGFTREELVTAGLLLEKDGRTFEKSLTGSCIRCHENKEQFCDRCHNYVDAAPSCFDCHVVPGEVKK